MATKKKRSRTSSKRKTSEKILQAQANKKELLSFSQISKLTYNELGKALTKGTVTEKWLKSYYASARRKAMSRAKRISKTNLDNEFGHIGEQYFMKTRNLTTTAALAHEVSDVNRYLNSGLSTIKGLRERKQKQLQTLHRHKFSFVNSSNYGDWIDFMEWFESSEYSGKYDSNDRIVKDVFESAETATPEEWEKLFKSFVKSGVTHKEGKKNEGIERR